MGSKDWYRRTTWSESDEAAFWLRWNRSRTAFHKAQYLLLQGTTLATAADISDKEAIRTGVSLLRLVIRDFPGERIFVASAHKTIGDACARLGAIEAAVSAYRDAIGAERDYPNCRVGAGLAFATLVAAHHCARHFEEAISCLDQEAATRDSPNFPFQDFADRAVRAIVHAHAGDGDSARTNAIEAIRHAGATRSPYPRHKSVGLVDLDDPLTRRLHIQVMAILARYP